MGTVESLTYEAVGGRAIKVLDHLAAGTATALGRRAHCWGEQVPAL